MRESGQFRFARVAPVISSIDKYISEMKVAMARRKDEKNDR
jgi:hypothetical protein